MRDLWAHLHTPHWMLSSFLTENGMTLTPHPPYLPDLDPKWHFLFPQMKKILKGKCFADVEEVKQKSVEALRGIKIDNLKNYFER